MKNIKPNLIISKTKKKQLNDQKKRKTGGFPNGLVNRQSKTKSKYKNESFI